MRINRTFSIPVALATQLKKKHNQSETVTRALRKYLDDSERPEVTEESLTTTLMWICSQLYTKDQLVTEVAQIINARDVLLSFIQEITS
jgi:metal-responsive CopG/Arc/MetJ family transcriptional regulator